MKIINFKSAHRKKHFAFFNSMNHPHFEFTVQSNITPLRKAVKENQLNFSSAIIYLIAKSANSIKELRWRIRGEQVVEHELVHPSFTIGTPSADVFGFCEVKFKENFSRFSTDVAETIERMQSNPSMEDEEGRDDYLFLSSIPWISFTGLQHAMSYHPSDSVPRISWGKFYEEGGTVKLPISLQAHHAVVDGKHSGQFFNQFEYWAQHPEEWLGE